MSAQPIWITSGGSLGTIPEGVFYQIPLLAYEPTAQADLLFQVIAGALPSGIQCSITGLIAGVPQAVASLQGVPTEVARDVTSKFTIRVYTQKVIAGVLVVDRVADRTFEITVTGPDAPTFTTPAGTVGTFYDGSLVPGIQIGVTDPDPDTTLVVRLIGGQLPPGCTISPSGLITGFILPNEEVTARAGFSRDRQGYSQFPYDFTTRSIDTTYEFLLEVSDGSLNDLRAFNIVVFSRSVLTADNNEITADNSFLTADESSIRVPIITTPQGSIGTVRSDNFFAFQFIGLDLDGDSFRFDNLGGKLVVTTITGDSLVLTDVVPEVSLMTSGGELPLGLTLDSQTGWLYGYIPNQGLVTIVYEFLLQIFKTNDPNYYSGPYSYSLTVTGPINNEVTWLTPSDLGTIVNGSTSTLYVQAVSQFELDLQYRLLSGVYNLLPQGLQLLPSGDIAGRCSFNTFALDLGATTFDITPRNGISRPTTFDMKFTFTVTVYSIDGVINSNKTFTLTLIREYNEPYENLYVQAMPPANDRELLDSLLQNSDIFPDNLIYRPTDLNFGVATRVIYQHAFGLTTATLDDYYSSLYQNHYWKNLVLGNIRVAQARDNRNQVIYEVVYSQVIDNLLNAQGQSVSKEVILPFPIEDGTITQVYPNSLINMRDQVIDTVGQVSNILPRWMLSKQTDGRVLGFTPAWVIAYAKPGRGAQIAYNIQSKYGTQLNLIDFKVDRYELDRLLTYNWDPVTDQWIPYPAEATTFDIYAAYLYISLISTLGTTGRIGATDVFIGDGSRKNFEIPAILTNASLLVVTVNGVVSQYNVDYTITFGRIPCFVKFSTNQPAGSEIIVYQIIDKYVTNTEGPFATQTTFDNNSMKFIAPVDEYTNTTEYDKFLVFPHSTILDQSNAPPSPIVDWINNDQQTVIWKNNLNETVGWQNNDA